MEKLLIYIVLIVLLWCWLIVFMVAPVLQPILIIITIGSFAVTSCCRKAREGR